MPVKLSRKDRNLFLAGGFIFLLLVASALVLSNRQGEEGEDGSSYSSASGGGKAAYLLLSEMGYRVSRWEKPLIELPPAKGKILILAEPHAAPTLEEKERVKAFIAEGGSVIATGTFAGAYLPTNESIPAILPETAWTKASALSPSRITRAAPQITLAPNAEWNDNADTPLYGDENRSLVVEYRLGRGEVLWWASATPLTNAGLKETGNLEFLLACLADPHNEILWDEYVHGYRLTLSESVAHSPVKWIFLQLTLLALAVLATFSRRSGPSLMPASEVRLSPIEFVQTLGLLYQRAETPSVAVDICYRRFRYWLGRRLGIASNTPVETLASLIRDRWGIHSDHFLAIMKHCEAASSDPFLQPPEALHLVQDLDKMSAQLNLFQRTHKEDR